MAIRSSKLVRYILLSLSILLLAVVAIARSAPHQVVPDPNVALSTSTVKGNETLVVAGGCFWGVEAVFEHLQGVTEAVSGYSGGSAATANYGMVSSGRTGHSESVKITYDPSQISYSQLLKVYFSVAHDPTQVNRQGPDVGTQYRSAIFFANDEQRRVAQAYIDQLNQSQVFSKPIATQLVPLKSFYPAEDYHQNFITRNPYHPYVMVHDLPKLAQLRKLFPNLYQS
ncbi:MAG: peptide-methionine (S)-S-oxide reductase MsrA [Leptolyngbyaceae bacterium]|nr:peptide-methionine (S)-S-oxide reductase MsrA [Leptolyngbyaceae bacterium]